jgi:protein-disulfide isomerase
MASRTRQKEEARARRIAEEQARAERHRSQRRLRMLAGLVIGVAAVLAIAIAIGTSGGSSGPPPTSAAAKQTAANVATQLTGISQSGTTLGSSSAPVTVTEYGDLVCPVCKDFAQGAAQQLIANDVKAGKVKLVYRSLQTASQIANNSMFPYAQAAAYAAGHQNLGWNYILLFYNLQRDETQPYVTDTFLNGLASNITGLNYSKWLTDRKSSSLLSQVSTDQAQAQALGFNSTPSITIQGPKGTAQPIVGNTDYGTLEAKIKSVQ